jgi:hypothetical protein
VTVIPIEQTGTLDAGAARVISFVDGAARKFGRLDILINRLRSRLLVYS